MHVPPLAEVRPGLVLAYSFLWRREFEAGRIEGVKVRPTVVVLAAKPETGTRPALVYAAAITHSRPGSENEGVEVLPAVKRRLALDADASFVVTSELNTFAWPGPDLGTVPRRAGEPHEATCVYGHVPRSLLERIKASIAANHARRNVAVTPR